MAKLPVTAENDRSSGAFTFERSFSASLALRNSGPSQGRNHVFKVGGTTRKGCGDEVSVVCYAQCIGVVGEPVTKTLLVSPSPLAVGSGEGAHPLPRKILKILSGKVTF